MDSVKNVSRLLSNEISGTHFYLSSPALNSRHFFVFRFAGLSMDGSRTFAASFLFLCPQIGVFTGSNLKLKVYIFPEDLL